MTTDTLNIIKDPEARLPYTWNWTSWLAGEGDTIDGATVLLPPGLTAIGEPVIDGGFVTQRVAGGTVGLVYRMICRITTTGGLADDRSIHLTIMDR